MSRLTPCCFLLALVATLSAPGAAWGRQTEEALLQRLDTLIPLYQEARLEADAAREAQRREIDAKQPTETVEIGLLKVLVVPGQAEMARDVVGSVWNRDYAALVDRSPTLDGDRVFFRWAVTRERYTPTSAHVRVVEGGRWRPRTYMEDRVVQVTSELLKEDLTGSRFQEEWGIGSVRPPREPEDLYRRLVVAPSVAVRDCLQGDAAKCLQALGLVNDGDPMDDWYSPDERRLLVTRQATRFNREGAERSACIAGDNGACDAAIRAYSNRYAETRWASPVVPEVRSSVLWYAMEEGGTGAWGRLLDHADDDPLTALEAVSGLDGIELAAGWRRWLMERQPPSHAGLGSLLLGSLFWLLLLITLAARSSRWRLG